MSDQPEPQIERLDRPPPHWMHVYYAPLWFGYRIPEFREEGGYHIPTDEREYLPAPEFWVEPPASQVEGVAEDIFSKIGAISYNGLRIERTVISVDFTLEIEKQVVDRRATAHPLDFRSLYSSEPSPVPNVAREPFFAAIDEVWNALVSGFRDVTRHGLCRVLARVGTPVASRFTEIAPDVFQHFEITDWRRGVAEEPSGNRLYSIHVAGLQGSAAPELTLMPSSEISRLPLPPPSTPKSTPRARVKMILKELGIVDNTTLLPGEVVAQVQKHMSDLKLTVPSRDTILRALRDLRSGR